MVEKKIQNTKLTVMFWFNSSHCNLLLWLMNFHGNEILTEKNWKRTVKIKDACSLFSISSFSSNSSDNVSNVKNKDIHHSEISTFSSIYFACFR